MKYRKKPVIVDAVQWTGTNKREIFDFLTNGRFRVDWLLRRLMANIWRILVIILSEVFVVNFIRVSQIYSEKLMRR